MLEKLFHCLEDEINKVIQIKRRLVQEMEELGNKLVRNGKKILLQFLI